MCGIYLFLWYKYSHHGQLEDANVTFLSAELGSDLQHCM